MAKGQTIKQLTRKIEASLPEFSLIAANGEVVGNQLAFGLILNRIFNQGKRSDGSPIGTYKLGPYKVKREKAGRQTGYKDFQFSGDLFNSVQVGLLNERPAVGIINQKEAEISQHLEKQIGGVVFQASTEERDKALEAARDYSFNRIKELMRSWS